MMLGVMLGRSSSKVNQQATINLRLVGRRSAPLYPYPSGYNLFSVLSLPTTLQPLIEILSCFCGDIYQIIFAATRHLLVKRTRTPYKPISSQWLYAINSEPFQQVPNLFASLEDCVSCSMSRNEDYFRMHNSSRLAYAALVHEFLLTTYLCGAGFFA
jgi:hypothetical protein